ncbi:MAG: hypothetical protein VX043_01000 [Candidatus Thermoplasmatota archaeon]|nr:hypothetical protein [Candidatus Thermoplasmatota archaeon]MEC8249078.1 hypothetical protein [Candidatus Thermoplasmatota archaeon]MEC8313376.1 hypothetical protein [Candidatus Thermoplasmatota archaeon]
MGLLDKAGGSSGKTEAKPKAKAKPAAKAKPVAKATPVAEEPVAAVEPKPAKAAKKKREKKERKPRAPRPTGLPEGFEIANKLDRTMSWFVNFAWNFGVLLAAIFMMAGDTSVVTTILLIVSLVMIILNVVVLPIKTGRNLGQFVARIKFVNSTGERATPFQGMLSNSVGIFALFGLLFVFVSTSKFGDKDAGAGPIVWTVIGAIFLILYIVNWQFAKASQYNQGLYDVIFGAFLVKHVPTKEEKASGFWAKFESMGDYGDKFAARREARRVAKEQQAEEEAKEAAAKDDTEETGEDSGEDKPKAKPKAKAKAKPKAKASTK